MKIEEAEIKYQQLKSEIEEILYDVRDDIWSPKEGLNKIMDTIFTELQWIER